MGLGADLTLVGKDVIRLVLGPGWEQAGRIFTFFGPGVGIMLLYGTIGWIHLSIGTPNRWFRWVAVEFTVTGLLFLLGLAWGPEGMAMAWTASFWILTIPAFWYAGKPIGLRITPVVASVWRFVIASVLAGFTSAAIIRTTRSFAASSDSAGALARIVIISTLFGGLYLGAVVLLHRGYAPIHQLLRLSREMVPWRRLSMPSPVISATCDPGTREALTP